MHNQRDPVVTQLQCHLTDKARAKALQTKLAKEDRNIGELPLFPRGHVKKNRLIAVNNSNEVIFVMHLKDGRILPLDDGRWTK